MNAQCAHCHMSASGRMGYYTVCRWINRENGPRFPDIHTTPLASPWNRQKLQIEKCPSNDATISLLPTLNRFYFTGELAECDRNQITAKKCQNELTTSVENIACQDSHFTRSFLPIIECRFNLRFFLSLPFSQHRTTATMQKAIRTKTRKIWKD